MCCLEECSGWRGRCCGALRWESPCSFPRLHLRHSRGSASGTAWGRTSRGPFEISWEWDPSTCKHGRALGRRAGSSPWVPGLSRGPPHSRISAGCLREDLSCQGQGNRDNAGRRPGETTRLRWTGRFLASQVHGRVVRLLLNRI